MSESAPIIGAITGAWESAPALAAAESASAPTVPVLAGHAIPRAKAKSPKPSYLLSAAGGFFLGVLGAAVSYLFLDPHPAVIAVPLAAGLLSALLGTYVAAEPIDELEKRLQAAEGRVGGGPIEAMSAPVSSTEKTAIAEIRKNFENNSLRLAKEAAALGEDGIKIAEAAEILRNGSELLKFEKH